APRIPPIRVPSPLSPAGIDRTDRSGQPWRGADRHDRGLRVIPTGVMRRGGHHGAPIDAVVQSPAGSSSPPRAGLAIQQQIAEQAAAMRPAASGNDFQTLHEIVAKARQNLSQNDWDYIVGGAETETTLRRNRHALDTIAFRPRVLRDVSHIDT